jgi:Flp pilus assembly protein TadG
MIRHRPLTRPFRFLRSDLGATAAEFALILPLLTLVTIGSINLGVMMYTVTSLHYAVEDAARCATVQAPVCTASGKTPVTYAATRYKGIGAATFRLTKPSCGNLMTGTVAYIFQAGLVSMSVPMTAKACRPLN